MKTTVSSISHIEVGINGVYYAMKELSLVDFKKLCEKIAPVTFIFDSENQSHNECFARIVAQYQDMVTMLRPNRICFKNNMGYMYLSEIKSIQCKNKPGDSSYIFHIICGNSEENSYVILADKKI